MGCHGNGYILYSLNEFFLEDIFSHLVGPSEQIDTNDKLSWGARYAKSVARPINTLPILKMGGVITSGK